jgi:ribosomal protein L21
MSANTASADPSAASKILTWEEIKALHPDEWVVIGDPVFEGMTILHGRVISHHRDKRVAAIEAGKRRSEFEHFTFRFSGRVSAVPRRTIGLMRTIKN